LIFKKAGNKSNPREHLPSLGRIYPSAVSMGAGCDEFEVFLSRRGRDRVTRGDTVFNVKICRIPDLPCDLIASVALGHTPGQRRNGGDVSAVFFPLKDDCIAYGGNAFESIRAASRSV
jgi:hypothetical protein